MKSVVLIDCYTTENGAFRCKKSVCHATYIVLNVVL